MENNLNERVLALESEIAELKSKVNKNWYSNQYIFDVPVKFRRSNIYPKDTTTIPSGTSAGRITIILDDGTTKHIPYF